MTILQLDSIELARKIRCSALKMVYQANASHIASALSMCDIVAVLYGQILNINPSDPLDSSRDRFVLSKGHACVAIYAVLSEIGVIPSEFLSDYGKDFSILMNHISHKVPGVEFSTGSLGHGLPFGVGKALAAKRINASWNTIVLLSDGELDEGSNWEAFMFAAHHSLSNLLAIIDYNKLQSLTTIDSTLRIEPLVDKIRSFGWAVKEVDGHDHASLSETLCSFPFMGTRPSLLIAHTTKGKGVSFMENKVEWHYKSPSKEQLKIALGELDNA